MVKPALIRAKTFVQLSYRQVEKLQKKDFVRVGIRKSNLSGHILAWGSNLYYFFFLFFFVKVLSNLQNRKSTQEENRICESQTLERLLLLSLLLRRWQCARTAVTFFLNQFNKINKTNPHRISREEESMASNIFFENSISPRSKKNVKWALRIRSDYKIPYTKNS